MKHGDFTQLAKFYVDRPGYSIPLLRILRDHVAAQRHVEMVTAADVGAGTGKLTEVLAALGVTGYAVEPNDAMREEGIRLFADNRAFSWQAGSAEKTNLSDKSVDWILMGSSFHWTDAPAAMKEFFRVLKPGGFFTAVWNPRDTEVSPLHMEIEEIVYNEIPGMKRVSSGKSMTTPQMIEKMYSTGQFTDIVFMEAPHEEKMTVERYMNIWKSVNDIRVQAGEEKFSRILEKIEERLSGLNEIVVPYQSRAWTVRAK